jgi:dihydropteroate synthase
LPDFTYSIDTRSSKVAEYALNNGISIINDVSGLDYDSKMIEVATKYNAQIVIQHSTTKTEDIISYDDVVEEVFLSLYKKVNFAKENGVENIIIDPGIGFGKKHTDCLEILNRIEEFRSLKCSIMVGISRKSILGCLESDNNLKDSLSLALAYPLMQKNIDYLRVHNVKLHKQLLNLAI